MNNQTPAVAELLANNASAGKNFAFSPMENAAEHFTADRGWERLESSQDAWYYGVWKNEDRGVIVSYCEGDLCIYNAIDADDFARYVTGVRGWHKSLEGRGNRA